jgi:hypothetical protein
MKKLAQVYERNGSWFFGPQSKATTGLWIGTPPLIQLSRQDSQRRKGQAAIDALSASKEGVPLPDDPESNVVPMLTEAGVSSWNEFMKRAKCVGLELENDLLTIMPYKKLRRPKGALEGIPEKGFAISAAASRDEIGAALEAAMALSE